MTVTKEDEAKKKAERAFREADRIHQSEQRVVDEERRHKDMLAKTKRLRELRLAREAADAASKVKPNKKAGR